MLNVMVTTIFEIFDTCHVFFGKFGPKTKTAWILIQFCTVIVLGGFQVLFL